jgi:DNA-directed RNA polymerase specialized sigma24 family protein
VPDPTYIPRLNAATSKDRARADWHARAPQSRADDGYARTVASTGGNRRFLRPFFLVSAPRTGDSAEGPYGRLADSGGHDLTDPSDADFRPLLAEDVSRGWRVFIDVHTPTLVALIERAGLRDRDEAMEIYTLVCERLAERDCARLRRWDPAKGSLRGWLAVVVRRVTVDWVRSRAGRRRLFGAVKRLGALERRVFELYFWEDRVPSEIAELLTVELRSPVSLLRVLEAVDAINGALTERHYSELASMTARSKSAVSLDDELEQGRIDPVDPRPSVESRVEGREQETRLEAALAALPPEDAAIVRLHYYQGLALPEVQRALHLSELPRTRLATITGRLRTLLTSPTSRTAAEHSPAGLGGGPLA